MKGWTFTGWFTESDAASQDEANKITAGSIYVLEEDLTLYAGWTAKPYEISFDLNRGGSSTEPTASSIEEIGVSFDALVGPLPTATMAGYNFTGWFTESDAASQDEANKITAGSIYVSEGDLTLYAGWKANPYEISFN
jgi:uncharacterized repeat protein (TIGR02543 family)